MSNYRPKAVLTSFSKALEKVIYERLWQHINNNNVTSQEHYHFQRSSSTEKATHKLINEILLQAYTRSFFFNLIVPTLFSLVGGPLSGNECGSSNHI